MADAVQAHPEYQVRLRLKRDTEANWNTANPVILNGEMILVDTPDGLRIKFGDGVSTFKNLEYSNDVILIDDAVSATSENPVQNKAVYAALQSKAESEHSHDNASLKAAGFMTPSQFNKLFNIASGATKVEGSDNNGYVKINTIDTAVYIHPESHTLSEVQGLMEILDNKLDYSDTDRLMTNEEGEKLAKIEEGANNYSLPIATASTLGGVKIGKNLTIIDGVLNGPDASSYSVATEITNGLMSADMVKKLSGVESGANKYVHPTTSGSLHIPSGGASGQILKWKADGTATWDNEVSYAVASKTTNGLMSSADKTKLDGLPDSIPDAIVVDDAMSTTSENPVQNKVISAVLGDISALLSKINGV
ncbi:MAG TPA: hypothetical protein DCW90_13340 [Lachnospiraceae bacterium]|nr:hypothetical protein [Lachnospiraceae bacterium]